MRLRVLALAGLLAVAAGLTLLRPYAAGAIPGLPNTVGYFNTADVKSCGVHMMSGYPAAIPNSINSAATFEGMIQGKLAGGGLDRTAAEFIVLTMLGYPANTLKATAHDPAVLADWRNRVDTYAANGWVNWDELYSFSENTLYMSRWYPGTGAIDNCLGDGRPDYDDIAGVADPGLEYSIVFHNPGGTDYAIKKNCGNPVGPMATLSNADYDMHVNITAPATVQPGDTVVATVSLTNTGKANSDVGLLQVGSWSEATGLPAVGCTAAPNAAGCGLSALSFSNFTENNFFGTGVSKGYNNAGGNLSGTPIPVAPNPYWYWWVNSLSYPGTGFLWGANGTVTMTVKPVNFAAGYYPRTIPLCAYFTKKNRVGGSVLDCVNIQVVAPPRYPAIDANAGDVHAGGGLCTSSAPTDGSITGLASAGSNVEYVATATSGINQFGSNGSTTGGSALSSKNYAHVCRPDLWQVAAAYRAKGLGYYTRPAGAYDITTWSGVYFIDGNATLTGTINNKLTLVVNGSVVINGNIPINPAISRPAQDNPATGAPGVPSLGIIASGDINIRPNVTQVDAYMFANGTIRTCVDAAGVNAGALCNNVLRVNGFLMAKNLLFGRLGTAGSINAQKAEIVTLTPQLYLNPPTLFDSAAENKPLEGQGEKAPLF